jgi:hypothetical protein
VASSTAAGYVQALQSFEELIATLQARGWTLETFEDRLVLTCPQTCGSRCEICLDPRSRADWSDDGWLTRFLRAETCAQWGA